MRDAHWGNPIHQCPFKRGAGPVWSIKSLNDYECVYWCILVILIYWYSLLNGGNPLWFFLGEKGYSNSRNVLYTVGTTWSLHIPCRGEVCLAILEADPLLQLTKCWLRHLLTPRPKGKETHGMSTVVCNVGNPITNLIINLPFKWMVESTHRNGDFDRFWGWFYCWAYHITHSYLIIFVG